MTQVKTGPAINLKDREWMELNPFYQTCALYGQHDHICGGKITWEHTLTFGGKKIQEPWAIIPLCEKGHAVNSYQDAGTMNKEMNVWVALNRANEEQLGAISKAESYHQKKIYLNSIYGEYVHKVPVNGQITEVKKNWVLLDDQHYEMLKAIKQKYRVNLGISTSQQQILQGLIKEEYENFLEKELENLGAKVMQPSVDKAVEKV